MIEYKPVILADDAEALVNTVNCIGIMGRGMALQFKDASPKNFQSFPARLVSDPEVVAWQDVRLREQLTDQSALHHQLQPNGTGGERAKSKTSRPASSLWWKRSNPGTFARSQFLRWGPDWED